MDAFKKVLQAVGVWDWLTAQFPDLADDELLAAVDGDFDEIVGDLVRKTPSGEAAN